MKGNTLSHFHLLCVCAWKKRFFGMNAETSDACRVVDSGSELWVECMKGPEIPVRTVHTAEVSRC